MKQFSYQKYYSLCRFNYVCLSFNYVRFSFNYVCLSFDYVRLSFNYIFSSFNYVLLSFKYVLSLNYYILSWFNYVLLPFNYYISSCLFEIQLCSILSFSYYFLSLNYPWSFSHLIIIVCHAISYFMNFIELWLLRFNYSISIDRLYLSPQKHRWLLTDVLAQTSSRLSCTRFENGVEGNSRCERFRPKRRKLSTSNNIVEWSGGYPEVTMHVDRSSATASSASICRFSSSSGHFWKGKSTRNGASFSVLQSGRICR